MSGRTTIIGTGSYLPKRILPNRELEKIVKTSDEWTMKRNQFDGGLAVAGGVGFGRCPLFCQKFLKIFSFFIVDKTDLMPVGGQFLGEYQFKNVSSISHFHNFTCPVSQAGDRKDEPGHGEVDFFGDAVDTNYGLPIGCSCF